MKIPITSPAHASILNNNRRLSLTVSSRKPAVLVTRRARKKINAHSALIRLK